MWPSPLKLGSSRCWHLGDRARQLTINAFVILFFAIQLLLPLSGLLQSPVETRGIFSWNMYSQRYRCRARYEVLTGNGERTRLDVSSYFNRPERALLIRHRDVLPRFHAWLCLDARIGLQGTALHGSVACSVNRGPLFQLVVEEEDLCRAPNFGVLDRGQEGDAEGR